MPDTSRSRSLAALALLLVLAFFVVSGGCGLVYQVVWTRKLVLLFGSTSYAVSTVLSIFFLGLGLGAALGGRLADRARNPLLIYGVLEIVIGAWALLFLWLVARGEAWAVPLLQELHGSRGAGIAVRAALAAALLLPPCLMMGATLPLLAKYVNREPRVQGLKIGFLYSANTIGAAAGCYLAGFSLLPQLGYQQTTLLAAAANAAVGVLAMALGLAARLGVAEEPQPEKLDTGEQLSPRMARLVLAAYGVSGFVALALEVLWTRLLVIGFLGTTYAYTTMLTVLLAGLVAGGAAGSLLVRWRRPAPAWLGLTMALCAAASLFLLARIAGVPGALADYGNDWDDLTQATFTLASIALFPAAFLFGVTFPLAVALLGRARQTLGRDLGAMYAVNTLCGMAGALAGGYVIIPLLGTQAGMAILAALLFLGGLLLLLVDGSAPRMRFAGGVAAVFFFAACFAAAPRDVMEALNTGYVPAGDRVIHFAEHTEGTIVVSEPADNKGGTGRTLWINRVQATASIQKGVKMNRFQGALPLLFDRDPKRVLFMCFGSGITCGTLAMSPFERIDAVEINPAVIEAAPLFDADNRGVLQRRNVTIHLDDGRNFLLTSREHYDFITFEPMPLALAGVSTFYTEEYYRLCRARLAAGGLVSQWVPLHSLTPDIVQGLTATFLAVFPHATAWFVNADMFLIGSDTPLLLDFDAGSARLAEPELAAALAEAGFPDPYEIFASFLMSDAALRDWAKNGVPLGDDLPWAEFEAPKMIYEAKVPDSVASIEPHVISPGAFFKPGSISDEDLARVERRHLAHRNDFSALMPFYGGFPIDGTAARAFLESLAIDPEDSNAKAYLKQLLEKSAEAFIRWEEFDKLEAFLAQLLPYLPDDPQVLLILGDLYYAKGEPERARPEYQRYIELGGTETRAVERAR